MDINCHKDTQSNLKSQNALIQSLSFDESHFNFSHAELLDCPEFKSLDIETLNLISQYLNEYSSLIALYCCNNLTNNL